MCKRNDFMRNITKAAALILSFLLLTFTTACSGGSTSATTAEESSKMIESSIVDESSAEPSSGEAIEPTEETTSIEENSVYSDSSAPDPAVEERSYTGEEAYKLHDTKFPGFQYRPKTTAFGITSDAYYVYTGTSSEVTVPSEFTVCPYFRSKDVKTVILPETIKSIPHDSAIGGAFTACPNLEKLVILNPDCDIESGAIPDSRFEEGDNLNFYIYFNSDKSPKKTAAKDRFKNDSKCASFFIIHGQFDSLEDEAERLIDLATESYE